MQRKITGIAAAAGYLGYDKPDSFRRARTRHLIPAKPAPVMGPPGNTTSACVGKDPAATARSGAALPILGSSRLIAAQTAGSLAMRRIAA